MPEAKEFGTTTEQPHNKWAIGVAFDVCSSMRLAKSLRVAFASKISCSSCA